MRLHIFVLDIFLINSRRKRHTLINRGKNKMPNANQLKKDYFSNAKPRKTRFQTPVGGESMTKQSFKDECDINKIMEKFQKTGAITHYAKHAPSYGDATPVDYQNALNIVADANTMFEELPSSIRKKFDNDPSQFLEFVQDEKNSEEMIQLGLRVRKSSPQ